MSTITPNSDSTQIVDCSSFKIGDLVVSTLDGRYGTVLEINFGTATRVFVRWNDSSQSAASVLQLRHV